MRIRSLFAPALVALTVPLLPPTNAGRATPEQMKALRGRSEALLQDPLANYARIPPLFMARNPEKCVELRGQYGTSLEQAKTDRERAVFHYLLAESTYHEGMAFVLRERSRERFLAARPVVTDHYLAAFRHATQGEQDVKLAAHIASQFLTCIGSGLCGDTEDAARTKQLIDEFIDPLAQRPDIEVRPRLLVRGYERLGILERLWTTLPDAPPADPGELDAALLKAIELKCDAKALLYADEVRQREKRGVKPGPRRCLEAVHVLAKSPDRLESAWLWLESMAKDSHWACKELYELAPRARPNLPAAERLAFLDRYVVYNPKHLEDRYRRDSVFAHYTIVITLLMREKEYEAALRYADLYLAIETAKGHHSYAKVQRYRSQCLAHLGKAE